MNLESSNSSDPHSSHTSLKSYNPYLAYKEKLRAEILSQHSNAQSLPTKEAQVQLMSRAGPTKKLKTSSSELTSAVKLTLDSTKQQSLIKTDSPSLTSLFSVHSLNLMVLTKAKLQLMQQQQVLNQAINATLPASLVKLQNSIPQQTIFSSFPSENILTLKTIPQIPPLFAKALKERQNGTIQVEETSNITGHAISAEETKNSTSLLQKQKTAEGTTKKFHVKRHRRELAALGIDLTKQLPNEENTAQSESGISNHKEKILSNYYTNFGPILNIPGCFHSKPTIQKKRILPKRGLAKVNKPLTPFEELNILTDLIIEVQNVSHR